MCTFNKMTDITTEQIVKAIAHRKQLFVDSYRHAENSDQHTIKTEDTWIFNHVCTVLDHASKIMERPEDDFTGDHDMFMG